ncbi:MAG: geopeptide radical SAM maturase, partial [Thermodesulfobacteriota bacterium]|nr:geopeptide radical SAM maturase [Thermodesulfobacteriota bacterium]
MQLSRYLKIYPSEHGPDRVLLFSTKKASKVLLSKKTLQSLETKTMSPSDEALLVRLGMIVPDREEEKLAVCDLPDELNRISPGLNITVVLNLECNFSCVYCYEGDMKGKFYMSGETADRLIDFIKANFPEEKKAIIIDFYGGEPLLSAGLIKHISRDLRSFAEDRGATYGFGLITNGSFFDRQAAEDLARLGLENVKITLDGPAEIHDRCRPFKSGAGSFDLLIKNIKETCDVVKVGIGGNYERNNYRQFALLLDYLVDEGLGPDKISVVKFDPVMKRPEGDLSAADHVGGCMSTNEPWLLEASVFLREEILKRGYRTPEQRPMRCMVEQRDAYVVNFDGVIYKCPAFIGRQEFSIGDILKGTRDYASLYKINIWKNDECSECEYLPLCFGGCRYLTFVQNGRLDTLDCRRDYFDALLETFVKQDIKYGLKSQEAGPETQVADKIDTTEMTESLDRIMARYFPQLIKSFRPPSLDRMISFYRNTERIISEYILGKGKNTKGHTSIVEGAFIAVSAIRYIDDFIDNVLWPNIPEWDPAELSDVFDKFLLEALATVREFDPDMPQEAIELPRLEMHLALYPGQDDFDQNFRRLFEHKSLDMFYVYKKIHGSPGATTEPEKLSRLGLIDYIRDFSADSIAVDTDLNLYKYVRDNHLNPGQLIDYLIYQYRQEDPTGYRKAKESGLFDGIAGLSSAIPS